MRKFGSFHRYSLELYFSVGSLESCATFGKKNYVEFGETKLIGLCLKPFCCYISGLLVKSNKSIADMSDDKQAKVIL